MALYFTVFPGKAEKYAIKLEQDLAEVELEEDPGYKQDEAVSAHLRQLSKDELVNLAYSLLQLLPDWQYDVLIDELLDDSGECEGDEEFEEDSE